MNRRLLREMHELCRSVRTRSERYAFGTAALAGRGSACESPRVARVRQRCNRRNFDRPISKSDEALALKGIQDRRSRLARRAYKRAEFCL